MQGRELQAFEKKKKKKRKEKEDLNASREKSKERGLFLFFPTAGREKRKCSSLEMAARCFASARGEGKLFVVVARHEE